MWLFSDTGFVSAVAHRDDPDRLVVRARDRASLAPLAQRTGNDILEGAGTDYRFRVVVGRAEYGAWVADVIADLTYTNYKSQAQRTRGSRFANALHDVWSTMFAFGRAEHP
jgi:hypothetical protein